MNIYSQELNQSEEKIDSLFILVDNIVKLNNLTSFKDFDDSSNLLIDGSLLEKIKNLMFFAYAQVPIEFQLKRKTLMEEWRANGHKGLSPIDKIDGITIQIAKKYGWDYVEFMKPTYFMKVLVKYIIASKYKLGDRGRRKDLGVGQVNVHCVIKDILKGKEHYSIGDTITISYLPIWFQEDGKFPEFKIGNEYVLPLDIWDRDPLNSLKLSLQGLHTFFGIKNETVYTPLLESFWQTGKPKSWIEFKENFIGKYIQ